MVILCFNHKAMVAVVTVILTIAHMADFTAELHSLLLNLAR